MNPSKEPADPGEKTGGRYISTEDVVRFPGMLILLIGGIGVLAFIMKRKRR